MTRQLNVHKQSNFLALGYNNNAILHMESFVLMTNKLTENSTSTQFNTGRRQIQF